MIRDEWDLFQVEEYLESVEAEAFMTEDEIEDLEEWERAEDEWSAHSRYPLIITD